MIYRPTEAQMRAALTILAANGIQIAAPWDGDLDDLEMERFHALQDAISVVLRIEREGH